MASLSPPTGSTVPGTTGTPSRRISALAATLSPISRIWLGGRADEGDAVLLDDLGEAGVLADRKP